MATAVVTVAVAAAILAFARIGEIHGPKLRLFVATDEARGVIRGTDVWFEGVKIGTVLGTRLRPYTVDTARRVLVELDIKRREAVRIRRDSRAQIRPGSSQLGSPVVYFSGGTPNAPRVRSGDTLVADPQSALDVTRAKFADFEQQIPEMRADIDTLKATFFSHNGTLGSAAREGDAQTTRELKILTKRLNQRRAKAQGSLALVSHGALISIAQRGLSTADSLIALVHGDRGILGHMRTDTMFTRTVDSTRAQLALIRTLLTTPAGTAGRSQVDSAIRRQLDDANAALRDLEFEAARDPSRYSPFW
jgi:MlaD protein